MNKHRLLTKFYTLCQSLWTYNRKYTRGFIFNSHDDG